MAEQADNSGAGRAATRACSWGGWGCTCRRGKGYTGVGRRSIWCVVAMMALEALGNVVAAGAL